jgi:hypothetical protein
VNKIDVALPVILTMTVDVALTRPHLVAHSHRQIWTLAGRLVMPWWATCTASPASFVTGATTDRRTLTL